MKAISLWQPWASALFIDLSPGVPLKPDETRHWPLPMSIPLGQPIAIHAAKRDTRAEREFWDNTKEQAPEHIAAFARAGFPTYESLPRGAIIGVLEFWRCLKTDHVDVTDDAMAWGNYWDGRYAWGAKSRRLFPQPIPCVGRQGFFSWEEATPAPPSGDAAQEGGSKP